MNCPRCRRPLEERSVRGARIDMCSDCGGMFLDHGELNRVAEPTEGDLEYSTLSGAGFDARDVQGPAACPRCDNETMKKVEFNVHSGIVLDYCGKCEAFWLDGTELERIDREVRQLNVDDPDAPSSPMQWFAQFLWSLPR